MEDLSFGIIAALVPEFAVKDLPLGRTMMMILFNNGYSLHLKPETVAFRRRISLGWIIIMTRYSLQLIVASGKTSIGN